MKTIVAVLCTTLILAPSAVCAQVSAPPTAAGAEQPIDPATAAAARDLFDAMQFPDLMQKTIAQMRVAIPAMLKQSGTAAINSNSQLSDEQKQQALARLDGELPKMVAAIDGLFNDPKLLDDLMMGITPLYARHFTVAELHQIAAFYRTPVGTKLLTTMPQLMQETMQISQRVILPRISALVKQRSSAN